MRDRRHAGEMIRIGLPADRAGDIRGG
jgi:hypothetical protein